MFVGKDSKRGRTIHANFNALFLGTIDQLVPLIGSSFPELGLKPEDCKEMSWIHSILYSEGGNPNEPLLDRNDKMRINNGLGILQKKKKMGGSQLGLLIRISVSSMKFRANTIWGYVCLI